MKESKVNIFGVKFDNMTTGQIASQLMEIIDGERPQKPFAVFTPNPEIVMEAQKNSALLSALGFADIVSADGVGIVWASKYFGSKIKERASGYDIVQELFSRSGQSKGIDAYFLGGSEDSVTKASSKMMETYHKLNVKGVQNGYFEQAESAGIIDKINACSPDLLLVGLGSPKQEKWIAANASKLKVKVIITVGGSFDVMSGNLKRAPKLFQRLGLEWLYRLIKQPKRFKRMMRLPIFVVKVLVYNAGKKHNT